jgi:hypothetical protein
MEKSLLLLDDHVLRGRKKEIETGKLRGCPERAIVIQSFSLIV